MKRILFVCLGNICRSVTAEEIMRKMIKDRGLESDFEIDSAGLLDYHQGELADRRMREHASHRGYILQHRSRPICVEDFTRFDLVLGMDKSNMCALRSIAPDVENCAKVELLADYLREHTSNEIPDPYYGGAEGFELVLDLLEDAVDNLIEKLVD